MNVAIHQPHFLPWVGYLDRMMKADLFIVLDDVQFEAQNYQNRVRIKTGQGPRWITVPVYHISQDQKILDKIIDNSRAGRLRWGRKVFLTLQYAYAGAPFFKQYASALKEIFDARWEKLADLNRELLDFLRQAMDIHTPMVNSSELGVSGQKSELVLNLCRAVGADTFLGGLGGSRGYVDAQAFERAGVQVQWQEFTHPRYAQHPGPDTFVEGLSTVDMLFNCGPESANLLRGEANVGSLVG
jgi:hypothetical protein